MIPKKITRQFLEKQIQKVEYVFDQTRDKKWVLCVLTIANGFKVEGIAHRQFAIKHDKDVAKSSAYQAAFEELWGYYTFLAHYKYHVEVDEKDEEPSNPPFVKIGYRFHLSLHEDQIRNNNTIHVLALVDGCSLAFINIHDGRRWKDPVRLNRDKLKEDTNYSDIWTKLVGVNTYWKEEE